MRIPDISQEITFKTSRSGGSGGQNVNKVETAVEGIWHPQDSAMLSEDQKHILINKLAGKLSKEGGLRIRSQKHRSQLANKEEVLEKFAATLSQALSIRQLRIASKPSNSSKLKRLEHKKQKSQLKAMRKKQNW